MVGRVEMLNTEEISRPVTPFFLYRDDVLRIKRWNRVQFLTQLSIFHNEFEMMMRTIDAKFVLAASQGYVKSSY